MKNISLKFGLLMIGLYLIPFAVYGAVTTTSEIESNTLWIFVCGILLAIIGYLVKRFVDEKDRAEQERKNYQTKQFEINQEVALKLQKIFDWFEKFDNNCKLNHKK